MLPWDSTDKSAVSGTAFGLARALEDLGIDLLRVHGRPPRLVLGLLSRSAKYRWMLGGERFEDTWRAAIEPTMARNAVANMRLRREGSLDGIVQLASDLLIHRPRAPLVTYEDMTIRQAVDAGWAEWKMARRDLEWRIDRQATTYRLATACCTRSEWAANSIRNDYGIDAGKPKVVGVGRNRDIPARPRSWDTPTFLIVASSWERKNGPRVLSAFAQVRQEHPQARLHVVGRHPRIDAPGVESHGFLSMSDAAQKARLDALFAEATCFVMPSLHEPLGIAYAEAGAAGVPSIGTKRGGAPEVIGPGGTAVDPFDLGQLVEAMRRYSDPSHAASAGERARVHAQQYTWPRVAKRILNALGLLSPLDDPEAGFLTPVERYGATEA